MDHVDPQYGLKAFELAFVQQGVYDFVYTLGAGTTAVAPGVLLVVGKGAPIQAALRIVPA